MLGSIFRSARKKNKNEILEHITASVAFHLCALSATVYAIPYFSLLLFCEGDSPPFSIDVGGAGAGLSNALKDDGAARGI